MFTLHRIITSDAYIGQYRLQQNSNEFNIEKIGKTSLWEQLQAVVGVNV